MGITCLLFFIFFMLDQITKYLAQIFQPNNVTAIPHFLTLDLNYNRGMAWGMLDDSTWILVLISCVASLVLGYICIHNDWKKGKLCSFAITMTFAGCVGNLYDRAISIIPGISQGRGGVVDMISLEPLNAVSKWITGSSFPIFNLADAFLVVGLIIYAIDFIFFVDRRKAKDAKTNN